MSLAGHPSALVWAYVHDARPPANWLLTDAWPGDCRLRVPYAGRLDDLVAGVRVIHATDPEGGRRVSFQVVWPVSRIATPGETPAYVGMTIRVPGCRIGAPG